MFSVWKTAVAGAASLVLLLAGCNGDSQPEGSTTPPRPPTTGMGQAPAPFEAVVKLDDLPDCAKVTCWLPTQFGPAVVDGETVSLRDKWPMEGTKVRVLCKTGGASYRNAAGQSIWDYYGILVPNDQVEPGSKQRAIKVADGYLGHVGISWLSGGEGKQAPDCNSLPR